ncbi:MAG: hypothetical protein CVV64_17745 [Candidatus Wallbacteria bacterium HGW-Wallbacteria-1]|jgi:hypothetical protein|uniref:PilZ domain-containing protein n=1 Tax=Candidatus Wallbacteria bacterium HGW-Wallbacteria-1 TaxID=2013854 RepID=A0A2N1PK29_9BACT|nr:MAG: hypothetical protein CVV64_17745 [Candidatus Wallbacteria bacterium HGW-Wallbacteria-1]
MAIKKIRGKEITPGMILAETVYSDSGQTLYRPGTVITLQVITRMNRYSRSVQNRWLSIQVNDVCTANPSAPLLRVREGQNDSSDLLSGGNGFSMDNGSGTSFASSLAGSFENGSVSCSANGFAFANTSGSSVDSSVSDEGFAVPGSRGGKPLAGMVTARMVGHKGLMRWSSGSRRMETEATVSYLNSEGVVMSGDLDGIMPGDRTGFIFREASVLPRGVHGAFWNMKFMRKIGSDAWLFEGLTLQKQDRETRRRPMALSGPDGMPLLMEMYVLDWEYSESYSLRHRIETGVSDHRTGSSRVTQVFDRVLSRVDDTEVRPVTERKTILRGIVRDISEDGMCMQLNDDAASSLMDLDCNRAMKTGLVFPLSSGGYLLMNVMGRPVNIRRTDKGVFLHAQFVRSQRTLGSVFDAISSMNGMSSAH